MAKNKDASNINRTGIYDHEAKTITYIDPKGKEPERVYSVEEIFAKFHEQEISVTWTASIDAEPLVDEE